MIIAIGSDMQAPLIDFTIQYLQEQKHDLLFFGAITDQPSSFWPQIAIEACQAVAAGLADQAILFCWTGTGVSIAANKVHGIRAALCTDAGTARGARKWNDANALAMSVRLTSEEIAKEIIEAWMEPVSGQDKEDIACINLLKKYDSAR